MPIKKSPLLAVVRALALTSCLLPTSAQAQQNFDPNTKVYVDALWLRVHAEDSPDLLMKEHKKTMTLEEADKAGYRIGETGQSGRESTSFIGYKRKYPAREISPDTILTGNDQQRNVKHLLGCHRYWPAKSDLRRTRAEWEADGFTTCPHCIERGPSQSTLSDEAWDNLPDYPEFVYPDGFELRAFSMDRLPSKEEVEVLIRETLNRPNGIQELQFMDPVATAEHFTIMRFFFPVENWLFFYKAYRATGDKRIRDKLLESARHYNQLATNYPSAANYKAQDPEGLAFMYSMAAWSRFTLQLVRTEPGAVTREEFEEAKTFLKTIVTVLRPILEANDDLDPKMGIPKKLAEDFRDRAFNRAMNGIGTLSVTTAALKDLQAIERTTAYQPVIDRYSKAVGEYLKHWQNIGHFCDKTRGETQFYYPYKPETKPKVVEGCKLYKRTEDGGHYSHTIQGLMCIYESTPDLGVDEKFMTAVANAIAFSRSNKIKKGNKEEFSGHFQCATAMRVAPQGGESGKRHAFKRGTGGSRFHMLEAFRDGVIDALGTSVNKQGIAEANKGYEQRLAMLHAQYLKALSRDRNLVHLGGKF